MTGVVRYFDAPTGGDIRVSPDNPLPIAADGVLDAATSTASATSAATVVAVSTLGYSGGSFHVTAVGSGNTITFEATNDDTNWTSIDTHGEAGVQSNNGSIRSITSNVGIYRFVGAYKQVRARVSVYGSGTVTISVTLKRDVAGWPANAMPSNNQTINAGSLVGVTYCFPALYEGSNYQRESFTLNASRIPSSANTTNATVAKASAGFLHAVCCYNTNAALRYLKLYNKATAPTVGTDTPVLTFPLKPSDTFRTMWPNARYFSAGISYALTTGAADSDTTAVGSGDIVGLNVEYA